MRAGAILDRRFYDCLKRGCIPNQENRYFCLGSLFIEWIRITLFLYANEANNILMTSLGTHEQFTMECSGQLFKNLCSAYAKENKHFKETFLSSFILIPWAPEIQHFECATVNVDSLLHV